MEESWRVLELDHRKEESKDGLLQKRAGFSEDLDENQRNSRDNNASW